MSQFAECSLCSISSLVESYLVSGNLMVLDILQLHIENNMLDINVSIREC